MLHHGRRGILGKPAIADNEAVALYIPGFQSCQFYRWSSAGFGTAYSSITTPVGGTIDGVSFSSDGKAVALSSRGSPYINAYPWTAATGAGTKYANPTTLPPAPGVANQDIKFSPNSDAVIMTHRSTAPFVSAYSWNSATGFGTKYANPTVALTNASGGYGLAFHPSGDAVVIGNDAYPWNSTTGFGVKYAAPSVTGFNTSVAFSPNGNVVAMAADAFYGGVLAFPWNSTTGFGIKYANPASGIGGDGEVVDFSPTGDALFVSRGNFSAQNVNVYLWSDATGFGGKYFAGFLPAIRCGAFASTGNYVLAVFSNSDGIRLYPWSTSTGLGEAVNSGIGSRSTTSIAFRKIPV